MFENFEEIKNHIISGVEKILPVIERRAYQVSDELKETIEKLESEKFYLAVLGEFKRGKSTFLNALIGTPILPTAIIPLTSIITFISYGDRLKVEVTFNDGKKEEIDIKALPEFVTEKGNPCNKKGVKDINIYYPSEYLKRGVVLIDTPGIGSVFSHNTETTYSFIPRIDAAIFMLTADPPISQMEIEFLERIRPYSQKIFFVLNKIDTVDEMDRKEAINFTKNVVINNLKYEGLTLFPISAKLALQGKMEKNEEKIRISNINEFENALESFVMHEKGIMLISSVLNRYLNIIHNVLMLMEIEKKAAQMPLDEMSKKIVQLNEYLEKIKIEKDDLTVLIKGATEKIINELDTDLEKLCGERMAKSMKKFEKKYEEIEPLPSSKIAQELTEFLYEEVQDVFNSILLEEEKKIDARLKDLMLRFINKTNEIVWNIENVTADLFNIKIERFVYDQALTEKSTFWFKLEPPSFFDSTQIPVFKIKRFFKKAIYTEIKEKLVDEFDKHKGRVRADFIMRIDKSIERLRKELFKRIDDSINGIRYAISRAESESLKSENELKKTIALMDEDVFVLRNIKERFETLRNSTLKLLESRN